MPVRRLLAYGAIYVLWGGSFLAIREIVAVVPPFFAAGFRFLIAGLALILYSQLRGGARWERRQVFNSCLLGILMFTTLYAGLFWAEIRVTSGIGAVISAMIPVWIFVGEAFVLRTQRATALSIFGVLLGFGGVVVLAAHASGGTAKASSVAILVLIGGTISWSVGTLWSRRLSLPRLQTANAGIQMAFGGFLLLLLSAVSGEMQRFPAEAQWLTAKILISMAYLIIAASIVAFTAYVWLIAHEPATRVSSYAYINPIFALLIGALLAGERLSLAQALGVVLVVAGVFATLTGKQKVCVPLDKPLMQR